MILRLLTESALAAILSAIDLRAAQNLEQKLLGGKALTVRSMVARQTLRVLIHRKLKQLKR